jgi:hypothetical protein
MKLFHNSGWSYFTKFELILPQSGAKGTHVYALVSMLNDSNAESKKGSLEVGLPLGAASVSDGNAGAVVAAVGNMDVETDVSTLESALSFTYQQVKTLIDNLNSTSVEDTPSKGTTPDDPMPLSNLLAEPPWKKMSLQMLSSHLTLSANSLPHPLLLMVHNGRLLLQAGSPLLLLSATCRGQLIVSLTFLRNP